MQAHVLAQLLRETASSEFVPRTDDAALFKLRDECEELSRETRKVGFKFHSIQNVFDNFSGEKGNFSFFTTSSTRRGGKCLFKQCLSCWK